MSVPLLCIVPVPRPDNKAYSQDYKVRTRYPLRTKRQFLLDGSSRTALPRGLTFDRIPTPAEKRAAAMCYTKAAMCADGPEKYLTHPSSLGAKMMRMAGRLQMITKNMEDPEHALVMRTELQKMLDERNEELAAMTDNRDYSGDWRDLVRER